MENFDDIINWENLFKQSETFKNNKPFKFAFTEEIFKRDFYERLFETFPKYDKNDETSSTYLKISLEISEHHSKSANIVKHR